MKTILSIFLLTVSIAAFSSKYEEIMKSNIDKLYTLTSSVELQNMANQFERIAQAEPKQWLPNYYAAFCLIRSTFFGGMTAEEKQNQLDKAQSLIDAIQASHPKESEIYLLQAFLYQLRITDMSKGALYSPKVSKSIAIAAQLNPENPRVYYLRGSNTLHTPEAFGGGAEKAKPDLEKAAALFETVKPVNELMPSWGANHNAKLLKQCQQAELN